MAPVLRERKMAKDGESGDNVKKDKAVLMNFKKQSNYRERKAKAKKNVEEKKAEAKKKELKSLRDRVRYVSKKISTLKNTSKELKEGLRKISKSKRVISNLKIKKLKTEMELLNMELVNLKHRIDSGMM